MSKLDTQYQNDIVCCHCGHTHRDSWEVDFGDSGDGETEMECSHCDKPMIVCRQVEITYSTRPLEK